jgi:hypothetical protein
MSSRGRALALWGLLFAKSVAGWGVRWDIEWHVRTGRDSFWIPPHVMTYSGVTLAVLLSFGVLACDTLRARRGAAPAGAIRVLGVTSTRGFHLAAWGMALTVLAAPIDDLWHRLFGLDVTLWSPPHMLGLFGSLVNTLGCFLVAREVYPAGAVAPGVALVLAGMQLYGGLHLALDPTGRLAFLYGGLAFHAYALLAALLLPLAVVGVARATGWRWAPVALVVALAASAAVGGAGARWGFAALRPVSVIGEEIQKDPTSPIAVANLIERQNRARAGGAGRLWTLFALLPLALAPAVAAAAVDARRRPVAATVAFAVTLFVVSGVRLAGQPAFAPMRPAPAVTALALALTVAAALAAAPAHAALWRHLLGEGARP